MGANRTQFVVHLITPKQESREGDDVVQAVDRFNGIVGKALGASVGLRLLPNPGQDPDEDPSARTGDGEKGAKEPDFTFVVIRSLDGESTPAYLSRLSGSIAAFNETNHPYVAYSVDRPVDSQGTDAELVDSIDALEAQLRKDWPVWTYEQSEDLVEFVVLHLTRLVSEKMCWDRAHRMSVALLRKTAPTPDIKVKASLAVACPNKKQRIPCLSVTVENHSPQDIFIERVFITTILGSKLVIKHDFLTGELNEKKRVQPGDSAKYTLSVQAIKEMSIPPENMVCIVAEDAIGREYSSAALDFERIVETPVG